MKRYLLFLLLSIFLASLALLLPACGDGGSDTGQDGGDNPPASGNVNPKLSGRIYVVYNNRTHILDLATGKYTRLPVTKPFPLAD